MLGSQTIMEKALLSSNLGLSLMLYDLGMFLTFVGFCILANKMRMMMKKTPPKSKDCCED